MRGPLLEVQVDDDFDKGIILYKDGSYPRSVEKNKYGSLEYHINERSWTRLHGPCIKALEIVGNIPFGQI